MTRRLNPDTQAVRDYVTARDHLEYESLAEGLVSVLVSHSNLRAKMVELRLDLHSPISEVKFKLHRHIGTPPEFQTLILKNRGQVVCELSDDNRPLGFYSVEHGMEIHIVDSDPHSLSRNGGLEDVSQIQKYRMTDEEYDQRRGTLREWAKKKREEDPNFRFFPKNGDGTTKEEEEEEEEIPDQAAVAHMQVGDRCEVTPGGRRGVVMFLGEIPELREGYYVGVKFDEPVGRADGTVRGRAVFECEANYGGFIRPRNVQVGDFPERDLFDELDSDEDEDEL